MPPHRQRWLDHAGVRYLSWTLFAWNLYGALCYARHEYADHGTAVRQAADFVERICNTQAAYYDNRFDASVIDTVTHECHRAVHTLEHWALMVWMESLLTRLLIPCMECEHKFPLCRYFEWFHDGLGGWVVTLLLLYVLYLLFMRTCGHWVRRPAVDIDFQRLFGAAPVPQQALPQVPL